MREPPENPTCLVISPDSSCNWDHLKLVFVKTDKVFASSAPQVGTPTPFVTHYCHESWSTGAAVCFFPIPSVAEAAINLRSGVRARCVAQSEHVWPAA